MPTEVSLLKRYLEHLHESATYVDARGIAQMAQMVQMKLEDVYVESKATLSTPELDRSPNSDLNRWNAHPYSPKQILDFLTSDSDSLSAEPATTILENQTLNDLWSNGRRWALIGDPGGGKTTLLRKESYTLSGVALDVLGKSNARILKTALKDGFSIPVLIILRNLAHDWHEAEKMAKRLDASVLTCSLALHLRDYEHFESDEVEGLVLMFERLFHLGYARLFLDGLDEQRGSFGDDDSNQVSDKSRKSATLRATDALLSSHPKNQCLLTSRPIGYQAPGRGFSEATLEPFGASERREFFKRWCVALDHSQAASGVDESIVEARGFKRAERILEQIEAVEGIRRLATNPLLCTIIGLIETQSATLPENRVELYQLTIDAFIFNWEHHKRRTSMEGEPLDPSATQEVLQEIALYLHENTVENQANAGVLSNLIIKFLSKRFGLDEAEAAKRALHLLHLISHVAGIMTQRGAEDGLPVFAFFHLTFQEYLAARALLEEGSRADKFLEKYWRSPRWREVIFLAASEAGRRSVADGSAFIRKILKQKLSKELAVLEEPLVPSLRLAVRAARDTRIKIDLGDELIRHMFNAFRAQTGTQRLLLTALRSRGGNLLFNSRAFLQTIGESQECIELVSASLSSSQEAIQWLRPFLKDESGEVRKRAVKALGSASSAPQVAALLVPLLKDKESKVRSSAASALGLVSKDPHITALLVPLLENQDRNVRSSVASALRSASSDPQVAALLVPLLMDNDRNVRSSAASTLRSASRDPQLAALLIPLLNDNDSKVRFSAASALRPAASDLHIAELLVPLLNDNDSKVRSSAAWALRSASSDPRVTALIASLLKDNHDYVKSNAVSILGLSNSNPQMATLMAPLLKDDDSKVRSNAASALKSASSDPHVAALLVPLLKDNDRNVRSSAASALGSASSDPQVAALLVHLLNDNDSKVRSSAASALGSGSNDEHVAALLVPLLNDSDSKVRSSAAKALGSISSDPQVTMLMASLLHDTDAKVRSSAASALGSTSGDSHIAALLMPLLNDNNIRVKSSAASALGSGSSDPHVAALLVPLLKDHSHYVRSLAAQILEESIFGQAL